MSVRNFILKRSYLDLDYIYGTLSVTGGENPLNYQAIAESPAELIVVASNALTGEVKFLTRPI